MRDKRNLDGVYFRMGTDNVCFSDLTEEERDEVMKDRPLEWYKQMCHILANTIRKIGDEFDIVAE